MVRYRCSRRTFQPGKFISEARAFSCRGGLTATATGRSGRSDRPYSPRANIEVPYVANSVT
jgi:hypothetical protein